MSLTIAAFFIFFFTEAFIRATARRQLRSIFKDAAVSVGSCRFRPLSGRLVFSDVKIEKGGAYILKSQNVAIDYKFPVALYFKLDFLQGQIDGEYKLTSANPLSYSVKLYFNGLDIPSLINDFNLKDKAQASGKLNGEFFISGRNQAVDDLRGTFATDPAGGKLVIGDATALAEMARASGENLDIIVESFHDYHYNNGNAVLKIEDKNLILDMRLSGETGKRNLLVVWHDFVK